MTGLSWEDDGAQEGLLTRRSAQNCLTDHELEEYLFDRLSGVTREVVEEHLLACERCQDRVAEEEAYTGAFRRAARQMEAEEFSEAMSGESPRQPAGWRDGWTAGWSAWLGRRTLLAVAGVCVVVAGALAISEARRPAGETAVLLSLARGAEDAAVTAPAAGALQLSADVSELPPLPRWQVDVVNGSGELEHSTEVEAAGGRLSWRLGDGLRAGRHWVRLRDPKDGALVREFGLVVR
jgi:anti-sigma factor RsiW